MSSVTSDSSKPAERKTGGEEEQDSAGKTLKGGLKARGRGGDREEFGGGRGRGRGGKVHQKKTNLLDGFDSDVSPDFVPCKRRSYNKNYNNQSSSVYTQPDQKLRGEDFIPIMKSKLSFNLFLFHIKSAQENMYENDTLSPKSSFLFLLFLL